MESKLFEIRDRGTCVAALAIRPEIKNPHEAFLLGKAGYGRQPEEYILLMDIDGGTGTWSSDAYEWGRTLHQAHLYIQIHWEELQSGDVVDVEFILGETTAPKISEALYGSNP